MLAGREFPLLVGALHLHRARPRNQLVQVRAHLGVQTIPLHEKGHPPSGIEGRPDRVVGFRNSFPTALLGAAALPSTGATGAASVGTLGAAARWGTLAAGAATLLFASTIPVTHEHIGDREGVLGPVQCRRVEGQKARVMRVTLVPDAGDLDRGHVLA